MALSLQDLLVGFDASAPQAPRANASAPRGKTNTSSGNADPFAALFAAKANPAPTPRAAQPAPSTDNTRPRPERPASADAIQGNGATSKTPNTHATDKATRPSDQKAARADDDSTAQVSDSANSNADDASNDKTDGRDVAATVNATPAGIAPAIVDVIQVALAANATISDGDGNSSNDGAPVAAAGAQPPGLSIANIVAAAKPLPAAPADAAATTGSSDLPNAIAELLAQANQTAKSADTASVFAALPSNQGGQADVPTNPATPQITEPTGTPTAPATTDTVATAPANAQGAQPDAAGAPAAPASAVAQVAVQASRAAGATAEAVAQVARPNDAVTTAPQAAAAAQAAVQPPRPTDGSGKTAALRSESGSKPVHTATKPTNDDTTVAPAKDTAPAFAVAPAAPTTDTQLSAIATVPAPATDGDAPAPSSDAPATTAPIAAPAAAPQAHQAYAQAAARGSALPQITVDQVVAHVAKAADDGLDHLTIQLKPAHLGAIEVKLEMHDDGGLAKATISADRADTLDLLQRDSHRLERALENAGIKADAGSLSFNLRGDGGRQQPAFAHDNAAPSRPSFTNGDDAGVDTAVMSYLNARVARGGVDIRV